MPDDLTIRIRDVDPSAVLDPRLDLLHWVGEARALAIRQGEHDGLERVGQRLNQPLPSGADDDQLAAKTAERAREVREMLFSPVTTGVIPAPALDYARATRSDATETILSVLILGDLSVQDLRDLKCAPRSKVGDVFTAWVPWSKLPALAEADGVRCIELARAFKPSLDTAIPATGIGALHTAGNKARGVIVGVVDRVLDIHHPTFFDGTQSRVLFLWDQTLTAIGTEAAPPASASGPGGTFALTGLDYGVEYSRSQITPQVMSFAANTNSPPYDQVRHKPPDYAGPLNAHGTFVAGIAAGSSDGALAAYDGAAPASDLVFVHFKTESEALPLAESTHVLHAFDYIFKRASALDQACVVNFSYDDAQGAHDGTSLLETALDAHLNLPGRAITISAGNDNQQDWHAAGSLTAQGLSFEASIELRITSGSDVPEEAQVWFSQKRAFEFALDFTPTGKPTENWIPWTSVNHTVEAISAKHHTTALAAIILADPHNGHSMVEFILLPAPGKTMAKGRFSLRLKSDAALEFNAWVSAANLGTAWTSVQRDRLTIGLPGTGDRVISVAEHSNDTVGRTLASTSGRGPARDNDRQPFVTAPGSVKAPKPTNRAQFKNASIFYSSFSGTSAAAPLVAGTCALMFRCLGADSDWSMLRDALQHDAVQPTGSAWDEGWGYGYLQAGALCPPAPLPQFTPRTSQGYVPRLGAHRVPGTQVRMTPVVSQTGALTCAIKIVGTGSNDAIEIRARRGLSIEIELPFLCLPWRSRTQLKALRMARKTRPLYSDPSTVDPLATITRAAKATEARQRLDVQGVEQAIVQDGSVRLQSAAGGRILLERLRVARDKSVEVRVLIGGVEGGSRDHLARVAHFAKGRWQSFFMLEPGPSS